MKESIIQLAYIASSIMFIFGLKMMSKQATAARGNLLSAVGMGVAIVATLFVIQGGGFSWGVIAAGLVIGGAIGTVSALKVPMTSMPEFVAVFNGTGGLASMLVGCAEYYKGIVHDGGHFDTIPLIATYLAVLIGGVTFSGSMIAYAKLAEKIDGKPFLFKGQQVVNALVLGTLLVGGVVFFAAPASPAAMVLFVLAILLSLVFGVLVTIPIGGADMPVVISLLNSYSGLAGCAAGFVITNTVLIVAGSLVGASGIILTGIMCKAMNRSLGNVLFSGFGSAATASSGAAVQGEVKALSVEDAYYVLESASSVVFVPGYGMAVAQAQHAVRELGDLLEKNGTEVKYAIHPVAGRMPGHMNVLLAEANVPYEQLVEMDDINPLIETVDVCVVIGANDVVNPAAREDETSPIYGMPVINVDLARSCFVIKRSMRSGFAGIENPLFYKENTRMVFGDAKAVINGFVEQFKSA